MPTNTLLLPRVAGFSPVTEAKRHASRRVELLTADKIYEILHVRKSEAPYAQTRSFGRAKDSSG